MLTVFPEMWQLLQPYCMQCCNDCVDQFTLDVSLEKTVNKSQRPAGIPVIATSDEHILILFQTVKPAQPEISNKTEISISMI